MYQRNNLSILYSLSCLGSALISAVSYAKTPLETIEKTPVEQIKTEQTEAETVKAKKINNIERIEILGQVSKFSALKSEINIMQTARSIHIETQAQFLAKGALTLDDALGYSAGVIGDTFGFSTRSDNIKIRGFDAPEYRDGMQSLSGNFNNTRPEIYTLEQIEVLKGPASVLFGPGSPGGIVNIVSKSPKTTARNEVLLEYGQFERQQVGIDFNNPLTDDGKILSRIVALFRESDTQIDAINDDAIVFAPSLTFLPNENSTITLLADYTNRKSDSSHQFLPLTGTINPSSSGQHISPTAYFGQPGFNRFDTESWAVTLMGEYYVNEVWSFDASSRYRDGESNYNQTWVSFTGTGNPRVDSNGNGARSWFQSQGFSEQFQFDLRARANFMTADIEHQLLLGVSRQEITNRDDQLFLFGLDANFQPIGGVINVFDPIPGPMPDLGETPRGLESKDKILGTYIHDELTYQQWTVNAGIRFDEVKKKVQLSEQSKESTASISLSALYQFEIGLSPYINYSESFQPVVGIDNITNNSFEPQKGEQYEIGIKYQPQATNHLLTFAYFDIELTNLANPNALPNARSQQQGKSTVEGVEFEGIINFDLWSIEVNLSWLDSQDPEGFQRASVPEQQASTWIQYHSNNYDQQGLRAGFGVRYAGEIASSAFAFSANEFITIQTPSYTTFDAMLGYRTKQWDFTINARNLSNKTYFATCLARGDCFPGEERNIVGRATYHF